MTLAVSQDYLTLAELMLKAQRKYILSKTKDNKFKKGFECQINYFIKEVEPNNIASYSIFREWVPRVIKVRKLRLAFIDRVFNSSELEGEALANEVVLDIIQSIDTRFLEGGNRLYEALLSAKDYRRAKEK